MRTLVIVGGASSWEATPRDHEIWCISTVYQRLLSRGHYNIKHVFQLHGKALFEPWLPSLRERAVVIQETMTVPHATVLPTADLVSYFGPRFTSSAAWMLGWAILSGYEQILLYGLDMKTATEYEQQRDALMYLWGLAQGRGILVHGAPGSGIEMKKGTYGLKEKP